MGQGFDPFTPTTRSVMSDGKTSIFSDKARANLPEKWAQRVQDMSLVALVPFKDHPFKVVDDEAMASLTASIERDGIHTPLLVRKTGDGRFEILSGHRRFHAAHLLGLTTVPVIVLNVDDDQATIIMVDANLNRPKLLISEQAKSMKQRYDALKHQGARHGVDGITTAQKLAVKYAKSEATIRRLVTLGSLPDVILDLVDVKRISEATARTMTSFTTRELTTIGEYMRSHPKVKLTGELVAELSTHGMDYYPLNEAALNRLFTHTSEKKLPDMPSVKVTIPRDLLPNDVLSPDQVTRYVLSALKHYQKTGNPVNSAEDMTNQGVVL
ncbi:ParB/RepB/Spo0J family partition protein [Alloscardovia theropitheci]|uniref:ParB/RepB/Spo0J family partition protein n=1 Tax=Alloscardovia theropitheci TaxID=2496842 RepID=A0A4V2MTW7_9BIFI|nr:ParB/RepB/Spo0J family partition protein [Alloscardovia theropitheci]TCD54109.1 ParB/RepB/Spo0J family partition protein [Alloscardovia theropitheci]